MFVMITVRLIIVRHDKCSLNINVRDENCYGTLSGQRLEHLQEYILLEHLLLKLSLVAHCALYVK